MRHFPTLLAHELRMLIVSPATYVAGVLFMLVMGLFYFLVLYYYDSEPQSELPTTLFYQLFWMPVLFIVPLLTMRSLADERRHGTLEATLTTPASTMELVLAKYGAAYFLYVVFWGLTLLYPCIANAYLPVGRADPRLVDPAALIGGTSFVAVTGLLYVAVGVFASSLTRSTLVAGMVTFSLLIVLVLGGQLLEKVPIRAESWAAWFPAALDYVRTFRQLDDFAHGVVDTRPFFLYASNTILVLGVTTLVVESRGGN